MEAQRGEGTFLRSHSIQTAELELTARPESRPPSSPQPLLPCQGRVNQMQTGNCHDWGNPGGESRNKSVLKEASWPSEVLGLWLTASLQGSLGRGRGEQNSPHHGLFTSGLPLQAPQTQARGGEPAGGQDSSTEMKRSPHPGPVSRLTEGPRPRSLGSSRLSPEPISGRLKLLIKSQLP